MISGMYLGEIVRLIIMRCADANLLFNGHTSVELQTPGRFYTKYISEIETCVFLLPTNSASYPQRDGK